MRLHVLAALALFFFAPPLWAGDREGEEHFARGVELYQEGNYKAAVVEFRRSYEASRRFGVLYNVGQAQYQTVDYVGALTTFRRYLRDGGDKIPHARRAEVEQEIARLRTRVGRMNIKVAQAGAEITVDDDKVGMSPLPDEVLVSTGVRRVTVTKDGYKPFSKAIDVAGGDSTKVDVGLLPVTDGNEANEVSPPRPPVEPVQEKRIPWEGWITAGALTVGAVVTGVIALKENSDLVDARGTFNVPSATLSGASTRTKAFAIISDVCTVGALVAGGISLYLTLKPEPAEKTRIGIGPGGASLSGTF